jgi:hypothetical protein
MVWKMSIDLDRVLVPSTGQHDPLDAWIAYLELRSAAAAPGSSVASATLAREIEEAVTLCEGAAWATDDPLGLGALLVSAYRLAAMMGEPGVEGGAELLGRIVEAAEVGLDAYARGEPLAEPTSRRLAFRELGARHRPARARADAGAHREISAGPRTAGGPGALPWRDGSTTSGPPRATVKGPPGAPMATSTR